MSTYNKEYYEAHKDNFRTARKKWNEKNKERLNEYSKNYYHTHKEDPKYMAKVRASQKKWRDAHKESEKIKRRERYLKKKQELEELQNKGFINKLKRMFKKEK